MDHRLALSGNKPRTVGRDQPHGGAKQFRGNRKGTAGDDMRSWIPATASWQALQTSPTREPWQCRSAPGRLRANSEIWRFWHRNVWSKSFIYLLKNVAKEPLCRARSNFAISSIIELRNHMFNACFVVNVKCRVSFSANLSRTSSGRALVRANISRACLPYIKKLQRRGGTMVEKKGGKTKVGVKSEEIGRMFSLVACRIVPSRALCVQRCIN